MEKIEIDITSQVVRIVCANCKKEFIKSFDELKEVGIVKCSKCGHEHFLMKIKN